MDSVSCRIFVVKDGWGLSESVSFYRQLSDGVSSYRQLSESVSFYRQLWPVGMS